MGNRTLAVSVLAGIITLVTVPAFADDAPRVDAFAQGLELQRTSQYSNALDAFRNAYRAEPTPGSLLHIAECEIALGRLVKAADHLKALVDATILDGSPPEFFAAQAQGKIELDELTPRVRVGHITVRLPPSNAQNVLVTLDGWTLDTAEWGVAQRVDPGSHVVVVAARDHVPVTATLTVGEGQSVVSDVPIGVFAPATREHGSSEVLSPGLVGGGILITALGAAALVGGGLYIIGSGLACFMTCSGNSTATAAAGIVALSGLGAAVLIGLPMIIIGKQKVSSAAPRVALSPRGAQLGWAF